MYFKEELKKLGITMEMLLPSDLKITDTPLQTIERIRARIYG